ncbi:hypothetical protein L1047_08880 [Synechococcus sp. Nb3U1]|uniref:hypothetical protein n=1 Tax=Synechococcus sp. Nb3U1 TaxID=1914529 RepID=UPI001F3B75AB|nr:hypothetical protein [Synechococcus sp. Nb3U1]MCF2971307.1 hypothetical protein [Synechococcus sp. Nb3U1]
MKRSVLNIVSTFVLAGTSVLILATHAQAQFLNRNIDPRGPFVARSYVSGGLARDHIIEVGIAEVEVTGLTIQCFNLQEARAVVVRTAMGEVVPTDVTIEPTKISISLKEPAKPGEQLVVNIEGISFVQDGNSTFYFISAMTPETGDSAVPVGAARILSPARGRST